MPDNVTYGRGYIRFIESKNQIVLTASEVNDIIDKIEAGKLVPSFRTNREHVKHVKKIVANKSNSESCPKCGSTMVLRETKQGKNVGQKFWGCTNFPKCKGIVNVT